MMHLKSLKKMKPAELVEMAEELGVEGASTLRKQDLMFAILKVEAENGEEIIGEGTMNCCAASLPRHSSRVPVPKSRSM